MTSWCPGNPMNDNCSIEPFELNANDESWDFCPPLPLRFFSQCLTIFHCLSYFSTSWQI